MSGKLAVAAAVASVLLSAAAQRPEPTTVSAAVSLTDALEAVGEAYRASGGSPVRFNFAGSNVLARQIISGAPVDLFISADIRQMALAERAGAIDTRSRVSLLGNRLVLVTRPGLLKRLPDVAALAGPAVRRIGIGDPDAVPAGVYAKQYLEAVGLWDVLERRCVPLANVRAALAAAANGSADAAFVYETDVTASAGVEVAFAVTGPHAPLIVYPAAITARAPNRAGAVRFLAYLQGPDAMAVFAAHGFRPAPRDPQ